MMSLLSARAGALIRPIGGRNAARFGITWGGNNCRDAQSASVLTRMNQIGIRWSRIDVSWELIETAQDVFFWTTYDSVVNTLRNAGHHILATVGFTPAWATAGGTGDIFDPPADFADWEDFLTTLVARYKDRVTHWELWNEPDLPGAYSGNSASYAQLLSRGYDAVKAEDPTANVLFGGLARAGGGVNMDLFTEAMDDATYPCVNKFDVANWHDYGSRSNMLTNYTYLQDEMASRSIVGRPTWCTEFGYPSDIAKQTHLGFQNGEPSQAEWLANKAAYLLGDLGVERVFWFTARDDAEFGATFEKHGLITDTTHVPRQAFLRARRLVRGWLKG